ncbi:hypothetical protein [Chryseobacterium phosphatilyticum]|nr:hypothetical protein [Chryseobacterium phosphatilyticum]
MVHLTLQSVEQCIMAAYNKFLTGQGGNITCATTDNGNVVIQTVIRGDQFDCGFAGYDMNRNDKAGLKNWCSTHPGGGWAFGFRDTDPAHPDNVNVILRTPALFFNFHVYLY